MNRIGQRVVLLAVLAAVSATAEEPVSYYTTGTRARQAGDNRAAKEAFRKLLEENPDSGGALEGLTLSCLSLGEYDQARGYAEKWNRKSPHSPYILGLLARAEKGQRDIEALRGTYLEIVDANPYDFPVRRKLDDLMESREPGLLAQGRIRKSLGLEQLNTASPQRIDYEGRADGLRSRLRVNSLLDLTAGAEVRQDAQINETRGFTYYNILEQIYSLGLEIRPNRVSMLKAEYGQDVLRDIHSLAVGRAEFARALLYGELHALDADFNLTATRQPKFLTGTGASQFFAILREDAARVEASRYFWGLGFLARAGVYDYSEHTTEKTWSLQASDEFGDNLLQPFYSHSQQEFFGALDNGHVGYVNYDEGGLRARRRIEDAYQVKASYGYLQYHDGNRMHDLSGELRAWLPWQKDPDGHRSFSVGDRYYQQRFLDSDVSYPATNNLGNWIFIYWEPRRRNGLWALLGYEHGFLRDTVRRAYEGNSYIGELEWYRRGGFSAKAQGRLGYNTVRDQSYSLGLQARYSFQ